MWIVFALIIIGHTADPDRVGLAEELPEAITTSALWPEPEEAGWRHLTYCFRDGYKLYLKNTIKYCEIEIMDLLQKNKLLHARAGFGISLADYNHPREIDDVVNGLFPAVVTQGLEVITQEEWAMHKPAVMKTIADEKEKKEMAKAFREQTIDLNVLWVNTMVHTDFPLVEKAALFWHGHFATHIDNPYYDQKLLYLFRSMGLSNFGTLLKEVSKSSAMLQYLNNQQNKKKHPNENFAREVMELFTLGRGHYSEDDIKEAARAFTGWAFDENGDFVFRQNQHDAGEKKFLGRTGNFNGDDILDIILAQKQTAIFITQKIYRFFVSDERIDEKHTERLAAAFYESNYDIAALLKSIFTADWFYKKNITGAKVKSPVELLVGYQRMIDMHFTDVKTPVKIQRILGQYLFNPPNVAGWPGGKNWIDSSSLVVRMRLPEALFGNATLNLNLKPTVAGTAEMHALKQDPNKREEILRIGKADADWTRYMSFWKQKDKATLPAELADFLLDGSIAAAQLEDAVAFSANDSDDAFIKSLTIRLMELPEYQLT